jgi:glutamine synthetase
MRELTTPPSVLAHCRELDIKSVALRLTGLTGRWHEFIIPVAGLSEQSFEEGVQVTGKPTSIGGGGPELCLLPEPATAFVDPFASIPTLNLICSAIDPVTREELPGDPRTIARRSLAAVVGCGVVEQAVLGFEAEYYLFDEVRYQSTSTHTFVSLNGGSCEHRYGQSPSVAPAAQESLRDTYARLSSMSDAGASFRDAVLRTLQSCDVPLHAARANDGDFGQHSVRINPRDLVRAADALMVTKYVVKGTAQRFGRVATFMPQPLADQPGSGLTLWLDLLRGNETVLGGGEPAGLSQSGLQAIGGLLRYAPALMALTSPSTNSYRRLLASDEAPNRRGFSTQDLRTIVRVPTGRPQPIRRPIEFRPADGSCNPYLALSAIVLAAVEGMLQRLEPAEDLEPLPRSFPAALRALESDHDFLTRHDAFTTEIVAAWLGWKREAEVAVVQRQPHPQEFGLYFDV